MKDNAEPSFPSALGAPVPFGIGKTIDGRTGHISDPGYQAPYAKNDGQRTFAALAKKAPGNYYTLR
jgi:hypothetical protein